MEIKTLAEILAENTQNSENNLNSINTKKTKNNKKSQGTSHPNVTKRVHSLNKPKYNKPHTKKNNRHTKVTDKKPAIKKSKGHSHLAHGIQTPHDIAHSADFFLESNLDSCSDQQKANLEVSGFSSNPISHQAYAQKPNNLNIAEKLQMVSKSALPKKRRQKSFHPASPYYPKIKNVEPVQEIDANSIQSILAQVKAESHPVSDDSQTENPQDENSQAENPQAENHLTDLRQSTYYHSHSDIEAARNNQVNIVNQVTSNQITSNNVISVEQTKNHGLIEDIDDQSAVDNLPAALKAYLKTPEQREAEKEEIKANSRLRWLAFYYLSRREHSAGELRQKLINKDQDPEKVEALLQEFAEKGYQSDYRTAIMLIREGIRKGRGRLRIKNDFIQRKVDAPVNIDELIDMAIEDNEEFVDVISDNELLDGVDWLRLAVEARVKKYGADIPTDIKQKAKQLRFLQYRGFKPTICFEAIKYNLDNLVDRY